MGEVEGICATRNYTLLSGLAEKLRVNAADEYSVFLQSFCALFRGVGFLPFPPPPVLGLSLAGWAVACLPVARLHRVSLVWTVALLHHCTC